MNFASYDFWKILFLCFIGSRIILAVGRTQGPSAERILIKLCLIGTGLILLSVESWLTLGVFLWVVSLGWLAILILDARCGKGARQPLWANAALGLVVCGQLFPLVYYKYWVFIFDELLGMNAKAPSILIPMGLSFYTFQTIGFWIDYMRRPIQRPSFLDYLNFAGFFPQVVAGPIEKQESLLPQIKDCKFRIQRSELNSALQWIILGFAYKLVIADNLGILNEKLHFSAGNPWHVWFECFTFGLRIYFDFAGYSFIAVGLGKIFGIQLTLNFLSPYWSTNMRDFWRRWHVTLGAWLRDYVYLPLGGRRVSWWVVNILAVFIVSGIWHGAGWGFIIWGVLQGVGVVLSSFIRLPEKFRLAGWPMTFAYVTFSWLFFFERDEETMWKKAQSIIDLSSYSNKQNLQELTAIFPDVSTLVTIGLIVIFAIGALFIEGWGCLKGYKPYLLMRKSWVSLILIVLIVLLAPMDEAQFIYFNF